MLLLTMTLGALAWGALACGAMSGDGPVELLSASPIGEGRLSLGSGCFERLEANAELRDGQIVVDRLEGFGKIDGDCASGVTVDLAPGPDIVQPEPGVRLVFIDGDYRRVDWCGIDEPRCVPFSTEVVPAECTQESLRFATIGSYGGVYPLRVLRCEASWALITLDLCGGVQGEEGRYCDEGEVVQLLNEGPDDRWLATSFDPTMHCPDASRRMGLPGIPDWVCEA
jgi:hypothetical protein